MTDINHEVESIMSRGFSRDHAVKIFFANHSELQFDPNASYNFDGPSPQQAPAYVNGAENGTESRLNGHNNSNVAATRPQFQQPRSLAPNGQVSPNGQPMLQKMNSLSISSNSQQAAITTTTTTTTKQELLTALSKSEDEEEASPPARALTRLASVSAMPLSDEDEAQIQILIGQGYPRVVATQMYRQKGSLGGLNKKVLQSNHNLSELLAVPQASNVEGPISLADYGIDPNSVEGQRIIETTPVPVPIVDSTPRGLQRRPSQMMSGESTPFAGGSMKYGGPPPSLEQPRRPSGYGAEPSGYSPPPVNSAGGGPRYHQMERKPSYMSVGSEARGEYTPPVAAAAATVRRVGSFTQDKGSLTPEERENEIQNLMRAGYARPVATEMVRQRRAGGGLDENIVEADIVTHNFAADLRPQQQEYEPVPPLRRKESYTPPPAPPAAHQEVRRIGSFTTNQDKGNLTPEERENEIQVLMHAGYSRPVATEMVRQRRAGGGLDQNILEADIVTQNYAADLRPQQEYAEQAPVRRMERKASGTGNLTRMSVENSYYDQARGTGDNSPVPERGSTQLQQQQFQKPVTRKTSSGTMSQISTEDTEREEDQRQIELMMSRGYTEEQARRATGLRRENLRQQAVETRTLESRTRSSNALPRANSSSSNVESPRDSYNMPTRTLPNNTSQSSMNLTDSPHHVRRGSSNRSTDSMTFEDQAEISEYVRQGFTEDQAVAMWRHQKSRQQQAPPQQNNGSFYSQSSYSQQSYSEQRRESSGYREPPPANAGNTRHMLQRAGSITVPPAADTRNQSRPSGVNADDEALRIGLLISEQDAEFGTNMYQTITVQDEPEIMRLCSMGYSTDDAVYLIFQRTYRSRNPNAYVPVPQGAQRRDPQIRESYGGSQNGSGNNTPSPDRDQQKKGFFHRPSFLKKLSGTGNDWNDNKGNQSPRKSSSSKHHHHHQHQQSPQREYDERDRYNRYNEYSETPEEREMRLRLRYNESDVEKLTELSFTREQAIQALVENHNNYEKALTMLLRS